MYKKITVRNLLPTLLLAFATAAIISTNTNTGAIAFSEPTNIVPNIPMPVACGNAIPKITPSTSPMAIRSTKDILFHF